MTCPECGLVYEKSTKEIRRQAAKGRTIFFCGLPCATKYRMRVTGVTARAVIKQCPVCGEEFETTTKAKASVYCSRECASRGSVTDYRRARAREIGRVNLRHDVVTAAASLRSREMWKYRRVGEALTLLGIEHSFEMPLDQFVFDLALPERRVLVEFDGPDHDYGSDVTQNDAAKDRAAHEHGWSVFRVAVDPQQVIPASVLVPFLKNEAPVADQIPEREAIMR